ncbi:homeodomain-interacting protein kinase 2-like [Parambassis ranga]|uniref:Homeodomain-interacting protein kinase 2-like n=1 Tax=Parambassis ranga TaxID=210632 RepID=A0A6P7IV11_9TELE|nr:homeodomain-interacting protein kinase 2-like [Parambassis ranga]
MSMTDLFQVGSTLQESHRIEKVLGEGGFGVVAQCRNTKTNMHEAVKINKGDKDNAKLAQYEMEMLRHLSSLDPDTCNIVRFHGFFVHEDNVCLRFELLDQNLDDYICEQGPIPLAEIKSILYQLATALVHLQSVGIIHADLKSLNVMVVDSFDKPIKVKVIDFGLAQLSSSTTYDSPVQTFWYQAPEVIVEAPFNEAIDMWTLGVIAVDLALGASPYPGDDPYDVMRFIIETQGQPADHILDRGAATNCYFQHQTDSRQRWRYKTCDEFSNEYDYCSKETRYYKLSCLDDIGDMMAKRDGYHPDQSLLVQLIKEMLQLDPDKRIKSSEVLKHPFFSTSHPPSAIADTSDEQPLWYHVEKSEMAPHSVPDSVESLVTLFQISQEDNSAADSGKSSVISLADLFKDHQED